MAMLTVLLIQHSIVSLVSAQEHGPFTEHFKQFLISSGNDAIVTAVNDYGPTGSFGGRETQEEMVTRQPVIFVHGNADSALFHGPQATGWSKHVEYFKSKGYKSSELYGMTYGDRNLTNALNNRISCSNILTLRRIIEAVLAYTKASKVDIIGHSMGVTLARKAIQGGRAILTQEVCDIGESIAGKIDTLVGLAGANRGMCLCLLPGITDANACSSVDGFFPGTCSVANGDYAKCGLETSVCEKRDEATVLRMPENARQAAFVVSLWSKDDEVLGVNNLAWGKKTSLIPNSDFTFEYDGLSHEKTKTDTLLDQYFLVTRHSTHTASLMPPHTHHVHSTSRARRCHSRRHSKHQLH